MQSEDARYIKRRVRSGTIDVHPTETALIVNYELEAVILGECGEPMLSDKKDCQKIIRLKRLDADTDCVALAKEVVARCTLIHQSKLAEVEHLIYYLRSRKENAFADWVESPRPYSGCESPSPGPTAAEKAAASFSQMEQYLELLYEELPDKVRGSALILELAKDPNNLEELANSESVLSALSRVLREDWKKSIELSTNIVYTFFCFSTFSQFHTIVLQYKIGSLALEIIDYELKRYAQLKSELDVQNTASPAPVSRLPLPRSGRRPQTSLSSRVRTTTPSPSSLPVASDNDKKRPSSIPTPRSAIKPPSTNSSNNSLTKTPESDDESVITGRKLFTLAKKQDQLLRVCFYLLLNIAENVRVEDKMRKRNLLNYLVQSLDRPTPELLVLVVTFLHKLSIYKENKDEMANMNVIDKLPKLLQMKEKNIELVTLKLLFNLSFDTKQREKMVRVGFIPKLVTLIGDDRLREVALKLLYHLCMDDRVKQMFIYTDCVPKVVSFVLEWDGDQPGYLVPVAICINLALNIRCAEIMSEKDNLQRLMARAFHMQDSLLLKIIRNISTHQTTKHLLIDFVGDLASVLTCCQNEDFLLECVGILGNLNLPDLNYCQLLNQYSLIPWIKSHLVPGKAEVDLVLEVVVLVGTVAGDEACSSLLCKADILLSLIELLKAKQEDDEMVLQIIYVFYQVARHSSTRDYLIQETEVPAYLIDLMHDKNEQIRKVCDSCLDIIKECNEEWADRIKTEKFEWHNSHWLSMVEMAENKEMDGSAGDLNEALPHYNILQQSLLFQTGSHVSLSAGDDIEIISNNPMSDDGSRPVSRYESETEEYNDNKFNGTNKNCAGSGTKEMVRDALKNLVISEDSTDDPKFFHIDSIIE